MAELPSQKIATVDKLYDEVNTGQSAEAVIRLLTPFLEQRLGLLLREFDKSPPDLGSLLDLRARISESYRMREVLKNAVKIGLSAQRILEELMKTKQRPGTGQ